MLLTDPLPDPDSGLLILELSTKRGNRIANVQRRTRHPKSMEAAEKIVLENHPSARTRSLRSEYNCVGMVFGSRRTDISTDLVPMILRDDGYRRISDASSLEIGDVVIYRADDNDISHVGIIVGIREKLIPPHREITVLSQWGGDGEYVHQIDDVNPRLGQPREFWTDRT